MRCCCKLRQLKIDRLYGYLNGPVEEVGLIPDCLKLIVSHGHVIVFAAFADFVAGTMHGILVSDRKELGQFLKCGRSEMQLSCNVESVRCK